MLLLVRAWSSSRAGADIQLADFEIEDLSPKRFMHKHLAGDLNADQRAQQQPARQAAANGTPLTPGEARRRPERDVSREFSVKE